MFTIRMKANKDCNFMGTPFKKDREYIFELKVVDNRNYCFYQDFVVESRFIFSNFSFIQIDKAELKYLSSTLKENIYRSVDMSYKINDIKSLLENEEYKMYLFSDEEIYNMAYDYVYDCKYDCNLNYWENLRNIIDGYINIFKIRSNEDE